MRMHFSTLQILEKRFRPEDARAIAEAIEQETGPDRLVTNDSLKLQLSDLASGLKLQMAELRTELVRWVFFAVAGQTALLTGIMYFLLVHAR